jgi:hypothetical protein
MWGRVRAAAEVGEQEQYCHSADGVFRHFHEVNSPVWMVRHRQVGAGNG